MSITDEQKELRRPLNLESDPATNTFKKAISSSDFSLKLQPDVERKIQRIMIRDALNPGLLCPSIPAAVAVRFPKGAEEGKALP